MNEGACHSLRQFLAWRLRWLLAVLGRLRQSGKPSGRVLVLLTGGLGDKLMALPAIRSFRREFAPLPLTLVVMGIAPPFFDAEADQIVRLKSGQNARLLREVRRGFDACFVNSLGVFEVRMELAAYLSGASDRRGPRFATVPPDQTVYTRPYVFGEGHETVINLRGAGGVTREDRIPYPLRVPAAESTGNCQVILHPGSSASGVTNRWPVEAYAETARRLHKSGFCILAVGTPEEKILLTLLQKQAGAALSIRTDLSLDQLALQLAMARLVIANDSGIGHLAASVGTPLLTIMGANRPERVAPAGPHVTVIGPRCEFGGCYNNPAVPVCLLCITRITPDEVVRTALAKLAV